MTGSVFEAYAKDGALWRNSLKNSKAVRTAAVAGRHASDGGDVVVDGGECLVEEKPRITFDDIVGMKDT